MRDHLASRPDDPGGIDLTAMIDVTFLLIIFWMVVTSLSPNQPVRQIELPKATVTQSAGVGEPLLIDVTAEPIEPIHLAGGAFSAAGLDDHLAAQPLAGRNVVLRVDRRADSQLVSRLAQTCYRHGAGSVGFSLRVTGGGP